jgi:hypothetical protein
MITLTVPRIAAVAMTCLGSAYLWLISLEGAGIGQTRWTLAVMTLGLIGYLVLSPLRDWITISGALVASALAWHSGAVDAPSFRDTEILQEPPLLYASAALGIVLGLVARIGLRPVSVIVLVTLAVLSFAYREPQLIAVTSALASLALLLFYSHVFLDASPSPEEGRKTGSVDDGGQGTSSPHGPGGGRGGHEPIRERPHQKPDDNANARRSPPWDKPMNTGDIVFAFFRRNRLLLLSVIRFVITLLAILYVFYKWREEIWQHLLHLELVAVSFVLWTAMLFMYLKNRRFRTNRGPGL